MNRSEFFKSKLSTGAIMALRRIAAAVASMLTFMVCMPLLGIPMDEAHRTLTAIIGLLAIIMLPGSSYSPETESGRFWATVVTILGTWVALCCILLFLGYATKTSALFSRRLLFVWMTLTPILIIIFHTVIDQIEKAVARSPKNRRRAVIAGVNDLGRSLADKISDQPHYGLELSGFFDDRSADRLGHSKHPLQILGKLQELPDYVREHNIDQIFITLPLRNIDRVTELLNELHDSTASIYYVPDVFVFDLIQCRTSDVDGLPIVALCETPFYGSRGIVKRASDIVIASLILALTFPLLIAIAVAVKTSSPGSVIFKQRRYGLDGHEIIVYKFRSMTVSEDSDTVKQATKNDARVTPVGAFLRKYSLDELPQFINVLQGTMSVVGPRPHAVAHNEEYRKLIRGYTIRHKVPPGITGLAQINGFRGETATIEDMKGRVEMDLEYLRNWSLALDLRIILRTASVFLFDKAAY